jgi:hypothetical protein
LIAHVCQSTGWTWDYVLSEMTLPRLAALARHWKKYPPVHILASAYLGLRKPAAPKADLGELVEMFGTAGRIK